MSDPRKVIVHRAPPPTPAAHEAAARIRALHVAARTFAQLIEAQIMEALWIIRRELPVDAEFDAFVESQTPLERRRARLMVETWAVARRRRELRELAQHQPSEALALMQSAIDAGVQFADATDRQVTELLSRPPRLRNQAIRELIQTHQAKEGHPSAAEKPTETKSTDPDDAIAVEAEATSVNTHPSGRAANLVEELQRVERSLSQLAMDAPVALGGSVSGRIRERVLRLSDLANQSIDRITGTLYESDSM